MLLQRVLVFGASGGFSSKRLVLERKKDFKMKQGKQGRIIAVLCRRGALLVSRVLNVGVVSLVHLPVVLIIGAEVELDAVEHHGQADIDPAPVAAAGVASS